MIYVDHLRVREQSQPVSKTVLIVDDNEMNMKLFDDVLGAYGFQTLKASHGVEALRLAREHRPDLILMDIQLPDVSGLEVTRWLKEDDTVRHIPVIALTALAMKGDEERMRNGGCDGYIPKPIDLSRFIRTVQECLD